MLHQARIILPHLGELGEFLTPKARGSHVGLEIGFPARVVFQALAARGLPLGPQLGVPQVDMMQSG